MDLAHLSRRFVGSLSSADPPAADSAWALSWLLPGEQALWQRMPAADRRHSIGVARRARALLGADREGAGTGVGGAGSASGHGGGGAGAATGSGGGGAGSASGPGGGGAGSATGPVDRAAGSDRAVMAAALLHDVGKIEAGLGTFGRVGATVLALAAGRQRATGWPGPVGRYLSHDARGASLLALAGSDPLTVAWAREHHLPAAQWTVPLPVGEALKAADDD